MSRFGRSWRTLQGLSWAQRRLLAHAWVLLPAVAAGVRLFGFRRMEALLLPGAGAPAGRVDAAAARLIARIVHGAANRNPFHPNCLTRSLVLCRLLRRQGLAAGLRLGVAKPGGTFAAHAWVEHGGVALSEADSVAERYASFNDIHEIKSA